MLFNERLRHPGALTATEHYVCSAAATIFGPSRREIAGGVWVMLSVYLDESGTHQASRICAIGGLVATPAQWQRLSSAWEKVLADVGVSDFHASHCAAGG